MNYNLDWSIFFKSTGIGDEIYLDWFVTGLGWTLAVALAAWTIALLLGALLGVLRTVPNRTLAGLAGAYVELFRNVPLLVQLFLWYFLVPDLLPAPLQTWFKQDLSPATSAYLSVLVCLGLFTAARVCEQVRTGIQALPRGQSAAALALGLRLPQIYRHVLLPQAFRIVIPPLTSEFLNILKNSAVCSTIGLLELAAQGRQLVDYTAQPYESFIAVTVAYVAINVIVMTLMKKLEDKVRVPGYLGGK